MQGRDKRNFNPKAVLKRTFGFDEFRPWQKETIDSLIAGNDSMAILPTGAGKSLIYQMASLYYKPKLTVVVSPLISLMDDQVSKSKKSLRAVRVHSLQKKEERLASLKAVAQAKANILYTSPESLCSSGVAKAMAPRDIGLLAVDEAHCISVWGHDFRPSYLLLPQARKRMQDPPLALFTATAPPNTRDDLLNVMGIDGCNIIQGDVVRDNIDFRVYPASGDEKDLVLDGILCEKRQQSGSIIVYCSTIKDVEKLVARIPDAIAYHGKMFADQRSKNQQRFMTDQSKIMVCTSAFGMGIDKPDIHTIIHYNTPGSLEQYIQESGRAGRDGKVSEAIMLHSWRDVGTQEAFIINSNPPVEFIKQIYESVFAQCERIMQAQNKPISYAQLRWFLSDIGSQQWWKNRMQAAVGFLMNQGFISAEGQYVKFPFGSNIDVDPEIVEAKRINDVRRLSMMNLYAVSKEGYSKIIKNYFLGATKELISARESARTSIKGHILDFVGNYTTGKKDLCRILTGEREYEKDYGKHYRSLPFISPSVVEAELDFLCLSGKLKMLELGNRVKYALTEEGAKFLEERNTPIKDKLPAFEDPSDYRNVNAIRTSCEVWLQKNSNYFCINLYQKEFDDMYFDFVTETFREGSSRCSGGELLRAYSGAKKHSRPVFLSFMQFFFDKRWNLVNQTRGKFGRYKR